LTLGDGVADVLPDHRHAPPHDLVRDLDDLADLVAEVLVALLDQVLAHGSRKSPGSHRTGRARRSQTATAHSGGKKIACCSLRYVSTSAPSGPAFHMRKRNWTCTDCPSRRTRPTSTRVNIRSPSSTGAEKRASTIRTPWPRQPSPIRPRRLAAMSPA